ncbi:unnamed protein product [Rhizoctonia solani]|uniref:Uncharacterized protein n=1 Tax=Rhizoctonia solani TaxID=456999 RepID=A0A8H3BXJ5_9AGAM|nr:uncharacterized protein RhiXN_03219 [Rhizoctonia solani]QRW18295.1 hypothetical protein RhiXN_03219 [Rhizoctonia solani]CAE6466619.1 unnamed protein product [Rhizoctonia solani]
MTGSPKYTPALSRFPTDSSNDEELDRVLLTPPDRTSYNRRVIAQGHPVPAHSPSDEFIGTPFSTSNLFEYPFNPDESSPKDPKPISIATSNSNQHTGHLSTGSGSPSSPYYARALREVSKEAPIPPSLREKVSALGA